MSKISHRMRSQRGSTMVEAVFTMLVILLVLFGLLQIFQFAISQMVIDYAAFRAARSASVGFNEHFVNREARVKAIPASGAMYEPEQTSFFSTAQEQFAYEKVAIERYLVGEAWLEYEYWRGTRSKHIDYHCPLYGQDIGKETSGGTCKCRDSCDKAPHLETQARDRSNDQVTSTVVIRDFPLTMPMRDFFLKEPRFDLKGEAKMAYYAGAYLEN